MVDISTEVHEDCIDIRIEGDVDASSSIELDNMLKRTMESGWKKIIVDCHGLEYISSAGLGVFMSYIQEIEERGIRLILFGMQEKVSSVFKILGIDQLLTITDTKEEAKSLAHEV